jgi:hypothetical protein
MPPSHFVESLKNLTSSELQFFKPLPYLFRPLTGDVGNSFCYAERADRLHNVLNSLYDVDGLDSDVNSIITQYALLPRNHAYANLTT